VLTQWDQGQENPLNRLPYARFASFNSYDEKNLNNEGECLHDTRVEVLSQIREWIDGPSLACIFWLHGMAGRGKSTIARTIARAYYEKKQLGASFFFSRGNSDLTEPGKFFTTIAFQSASSCPSLEPSIARAVKENKNIANETLRDQWHKAGLASASGP
jgi:hypothetical protein